MRTLAKMMRYNHMARAYFPSPEYTKSHSTDLIREDRRSLEHRRELAHPRGYEDETSRSVVPGLHSLARVAPPRDLDGARKSALKRVVDTIPNALVNIERIVQNRLAAAVLYIRAHNLIKEADEVSDSEINYLSSETVARATSFVSQMVAAAESLLRVLPLPRINPADEGSIDLYWELEDRDLLVNVPGDKKEDLTFFGESDVLGNLGGDVVGSIPAEHLVSWLTSPA